MTTDEKTQQFIGADHAIYQLLEKGSAENFCSMMGNPETQSWFHLHHSGATPLFSAMQTLLSKDGVNKNNAPLIARRVDDILAQFEGAGSGFFDKAANAVCHDVATDKTSAQTFLELVQSNLPPAIYKHAFEPILKQYNLKYREDAGKEQLLDALKVPDDEFNQIMAKLGLPQNNDARRKL